LFRGRPHLQFFFRIVPICSCGFAPYHHLRNQENLFHGCKAGLPASPIRRPLLLGAPSKAPLPRKGARKALDAFGCPVRVLVTPSLNRALAGLVAPVVAQLGVAGHPPGQRGPSTTTKARHRM
jgi:hypothetical protein